MYLPLAMYMHVYVPAGPGSTSFQLESWPSIEPVKFPFDRQSFELRREGFLLHENVNAIIYWGQMARCPGHWPEDEIKAPAECLFVWYLV